MRAYLQRQGLRTIQPCMRSGRPNTYTITFNANGGSGAPAQQSLGLCGQRNDCAVVHQADPYRLHLPGMGGIGLLRPAQPYQPGQAWNRNNTQSCTLYAVWKSEYLHGGFQCQRRKRRACSADQDLRRDAETVVHQTDPRRLHLYGLEYGGQRQRNSICGRRQLPRPTALLRCMRNGS